MVCVTEARLVWLWRRGRFFCTRLGKKTPACALVMRLRDGMAAVNVWRTWRAIPESVKASRAVFSPFFFLGVQTGPVTVPATSDRGFGCLDSVKPDRAVGSAEGRLFFVWGF